jgi:hypothetical protein
MEMATSNKRFNRCFVALAAADDDDEDEEEEEEEEALEPLAPPVEDEEEEGPPPRASGISNSVVAFCVLRLKPLDHCEPPSLKKNLPDWCLAGKNMTGSSSSKSSKYQSRISPAPTQPALISDDDALPPSLAREARSSLPSSEASRFGVREEHISGKPVLFTIQNMQYTDMILHESASTLFFFFVVVVVWCCYLSVHVRQCESTDYDEHVVNVEK